MKGKVKAAAAAEAPSVELSIPEKIRQGQAVPAHLQVLEGLFQSLTGKAGDAGSL